MLELLRGRADDNPTARLGIGAAVDITTVIGFALWYWAFDLGGPRERTVSGRRPSGKRTEMTISRLDLPAR